MTRLKDDQPTSQPSNHKEVIPQTMTSICPSTSTNMTMFKTCVLLVKNWIFPSWMMINPNRVRIAQLLKKKWTNRCLKHYHHWRDPLTIKAGDRTSPVLVCQLRLGFLDLFCLKKLHTWIYISIIGNLVNCFA